MEGGSEAWLRLQQVLQFRAHADLGRPRALSRGRAVRTVHSRETSDVLGAAAAAGGAVLAVRTHATQD